MKRHILAAALAAQLVLLASCAGGGPPAPSRSADSPTSAGQSAPPSADPTDTGTDPAVTHSLGAEEQVLLDRVRAEGTLSVIVRVALAEAAEPNTAEEPRLVAEAQDDLIAELDPAHVSVQTRFRNTAQLTLTVDEEGLRALFASSRVTRVWENESIPLD